MARVWQYLNVAIVVGVLAGCAARKPDKPAPVPVPPVAESPMPKLVDVPDTPPTGPALQQRGSRWVPVRWADLPGFDADDTSAAWNAWIRSCERPAAAFKGLCSEVRRMALATTEEQRQWMRMRLQPYRVESLQGAAEGLLTSYFEPLYVATRQRQAGFETPLYAPPPTLKQRQPWYTRQEMDTRADVQAQLAGSVIAWLADPIDAMILHIQGSGRLHLHETDGSQRVVRLAFAATNEQPYQSPGAWLLRQGLIQDTTWPGIKAWLMANPHRVNEFLWSNPRVVFFREEALSAVDARFGPRGAQGVQLTAGRSLAVDPASIPYGTPVWMASKGPEVELQRLTLAQDTGSAIRGAVRADFFAGSGAEAGELAGRMKQPLRMWVLWPK